jgi:hypothetical protein
MASTKIKIEPCKVEGLSFEESAAREQAIRRAFKGSTLRTDAQLQYALEAALSAALEDLSLTLEISEEGVWALEPYVEAVLHDSERVKRLADALADVLQIRVSREDG